MKTRSRERFGVVIVAAVIAASLTGIPVPPAAADDCPVPASGTWSGATAPTVYTLGVVYNFSGSALTGSVTVNGDGPYALTGTVTCGVISSGSVSLGATFDGVITPDGRSVSGTYVGPTDSGTWSATADNYTLDATSTAQPTTIAPAGATSWVVDVENTGSAAATLVNASFQISGAATYGDLAQTSSVSQGTGCLPDSELPNVVHCDVGTVLPGQKESAQITVVSTGGAGSPISLDGQAYSRVGGGTNDVAPTVTVNVVAPASLPVGSASGIAQPGTKFETSGGKQATPTNPIKVIFKLPKKVTVGTTALALSKAAKSGKQKRSLEGVALMSTGRKTSRKALGRPMIASVTGPSVPMSISRVASEALTFCGGQACSGDVIHMTSFKGYNDPKHPAKVTITWDRSNVGRGVGSAIFKRGDATTSPTQTLGICRKTKAGYLNTPCISKRRLVSGGDVQFTLLVLSGDPKFGRR